VKFVAESNRGEQLQIIRLFVFAEQNKFNL